MIEVKWLRDLYPGGYKDVDNVSTAFTLDDAEGWSIILARVLGHLNGRRLVGIKKTKNAVCHKCNRKAVISLIFRYREEKYYSVNLCEEHFRELMQRLRQRLHELVDTIVDGLEREAMA